MPTTYTPTTRPPFTLPRRAREGSPWHIIGADDNGAYIVKRENRNGRPASESLRVEPFAEVVGTRITAGVPRYMHAEITRQHEADELARLSTIADCPHTLYLTTRYTASGTRRVRAFIIIHGRPVNVSGYIASAYRFRMADDTTGRRELVISGHGFSAAEHVAEAVAYIVGEQITYEEV